jgi:hypothetical protein
MYRTGTATLVQLKHALDAWKHHRVLRWDE